MDLSIIIPLYNGADCICQIIEDIRIHNSGCYTYEILLIDDGSTDATPTICLELAEKYEFIHYFRKDNGGIASAREYGLNVAVGEFITFSDQDDSIVSGYESFLKRCIDEKLDLIITAPYSTRLGTNDIHLRQFKNEVIEDNAVIKKMAGKLIDGKYLSDDSAQFVSTSVWNVIYRSSLLKNNGIHFKAFIDYEDDWIFNIEALMAADKIAVTSEGYYCWNIREESESHRNKYIPDLLEKRKQWMNWLSGILDDLNIEAEKRQAFIENVLIPRNIMMCFNNACWKPNTQKDEILKEIKDSCIAWNARSVTFNKVDEMNKKNRSLLWLLIHDRIKTAYLLNSVFLKSRFH